MSRLRYYFKLDGSEYCYGYERLAKAVGVSYATFGRRLRRLGITLLHAGGKKSWVYVPWNQIPILKSRFQRSKLRIVLLF